MVASLSCAELGTAQPQLVIIPFPLLKTKLSSQSPCPTLQIVTIALLLYPHLDIFHYPNIHIKMFSVILSTMIRISLSQYSYWTLIHDVDIYIKIWALMKLLSLQVGNFVGVSAISSIIWLHYRETVSHKGRADYILGFAIMFHFFCKDILQHICKEVIRPFYGEFLWRPFNKENVPKTGKSPKCCKVHVLQSARNLWKYVQPLFKKSRIS